MQQLLKLQQKLSKLAATFKIAACPLWAAVDFELVLKCRTTASNSAARLRKAEMGVQLWSSGLNADCTDRKISILAFREPVDIVQLRMTQHLGTSEHAYMDHTNETVLIDEFSS